MCALNVSKCEKCGAPVRLGEECGACVKGADRPPKTLMARPGHAHGADAPSGGFPKYFPGRSNKRTNIAEKQLHCRRVQRAQRVGLIMVGLAVAIIVMKHRLAGVDIELAPLFGKVTSMFKLRDSGTEANVLRYATIALTIDALVLFILYLYSFARPVPGLLLLVIASIIDCVLLFDPVLLISPLAILVILAIKIVVMLVLLSGFKSVKVLDRL